MRRASWSCARAIRRTRAPRARGWREGLGQVETIVALTTALDDTAAQADVVLPVHSDIERFQAAEPAGLAFPVLSLAKPAVKPIGESRHPGDVVLALATALERTRPICPGSRSRRWSSRR